jgi:hypothetical protein
VSDPKKDEIAKLLDRLERAMKDAYTGSASPVFLLLYQLRQALTDYEALRETSVELRKAEEFAFIAGWASALEQSAIARMEGLSATIMCPEAFKAYRAQREQKAGQ